MSRKNQDNSRLYRMVEGKLTPGTLQLDMDDDGQLRLLFVTDRAAYKAGTVGGKHQDLIKALASEAEAASRQLMVTALYRGTIDGQYEKLAALHGFADVPWEHIFQMLDRDQVPPATVCAYCEDLEIVMPYIDRVQTATNALHEQLERGQSMLMNVLGIIESLDDLTSRAAKLPRDQLKMMIAEFKGQQKLATQCQDAMRALLKMLDLVIGRRETDES